MGISAFYLTSRQKWCVEVRRPGCRPVRLQCDSEAKAEQIVRELRLALDRARSQPVLPTVQSAATEWLAVRDSNPDLSDLRHVRGHLRNHILPVFGPSPVNEVTRGLVLKWTRGLREAGLSKKSVKNIHGTLHALFAWLVLERELLTTNPCTLGRGRLARQTSDEKRRYRRHHTFDRHEIEKVLSSATVPVDRRTLYALQFFLAARRSEVVELRWSDYDTEAIPLGGITISRSLGRTTTKTGTSREIPVHPVLARILAEWKRSGFRELVNRPPLPDDPIVPGSGGLPRSVSYVSACLEQDLDALGLRRRGTHSFRRGFQSIAIGDRAPRECIRALLHTSDRDSTDIYLAIPWARLCDAVEMLRVDPVGSRLLPTPRSSAPKNPRFLGVPGSQYWTTKPDSPLASHAAGMPGSERADPRSTRLSEDPMEESHGG